MTDPSYNVVLIPSSTFFVTVSAPSTVTWKAPLWRVTVEALVNCRGQQCCSGREIV